MICGAQRFSNCFYSETHFANTFQKERVFCTGLVFLNESEFHLKFELRASLLRLEVSVVTHKLSNQAGKLLKNVCFSYR